MLSVDHVCLLDVHLIAASKSTHNEVAKLRTN